jgi:hypothetical protein
MFNLVLHHLVLVLVVVLVLSFAACVTHYRSHPGALNIADSSAYDALLIAEAAIDQARLDSKAGQLPDAARNPLAALITAYNLTRDAWLTYRGAIATNVPAQSYLDQLNRNLADLMVAIRQLKEAQ